MPMTLTYSATTITLPTPQRGAGAPLDLAQVSRRDSSGALRVYTKSTKSDQRFPLAVKLTAALLADLQAFLTTTVQGTKTPFAWTDHLAVVRTVKFDSGQLDSQPLGPDRYLVNFTLIEQVAL